MIFPIIGAAKKKTRAPMDVYAQILAIQGNVEHNGKAIFIGDPVIAEGFFETKKGAKLKIYFYRSRVLAILSSKAKLKVSKEGKDIVLEQLSGDIRYIVPHRNKELPALFELKTENATFETFQGDFLIGFNPLLKETELYVFKRFVTIKNNEDKFDTRKIAKDEWTGLGGRFSAKLAEKITMPKRLTTAYLNKHVMHTKIVFGQRSIEHFGEIIPARD